MSAIALVLYTRPGCHLCEEMQQVIVPVAREFGCTLEEIDISERVELEARFGLEIPVLCVNGRKAFKYRVTAPELRRRLGREGGEQG